MSATMNGPAASSSAREIVEAALPEIVEGLPRARARFGDDPVTVLLDARALQGSRTDVAIWLRGHLADAAAGLLAPATRCAIDEILEALDVATPGVSRVVVLMTRGVGLVSLHEEDGRVRLEMN